MQGCGLLPDFHLTLLLMYRVDFDARWEAFPCQKSNDVVPKTAQVSDDGGLVVLGGGEEVAGRLFRVTM